MKILAIILLALGILMTVITGVSVITHKKVVDIGPIDITKEEKTPVYWSPWAGIFLVAVGGSLLIYTRKKA
ncbi:MAG: hypothetical protein ABI763_10860 [Bacteroidota bacterium]